MPTYASRTKVSAAKSREEIQAILKKYGASDFGYKEAADHAMVIFKMANRDYRFLIRYKPLSAFKPSISKISSPAKRDRTQADLKAEHEQHIRQRWRAMLVVIKAKLIAYDEGIETLEEVFFRWTVVPGSEQTIEEMIEPQIQAAYTTGKLPPMLQPGK